MALDWEAVGSMVTAIGVAVAVAQIASGRRESKRERTLSEIQKYILDPVLFESIRTIRRAKHAGEYDPDPSKYRTEVVAIINYFDGLAVGIAQKLYIDDLARDHLHEVLDYSWEEFLAPNRLKEIGLGGLEELPHLEAMHRRWKAPQQKFQAGIFR